MTETLKKLIELQAIDAELFTLSHQINDIPKALRKEQTGYEKAVNDLHKEAQSRKELEEQAKKLTIDLESATEHMKQLKGKQGQIRKNVEYQALTQEIKMAEESDKKHKVALD